MTTVEASAAGRHRRSVLLLAASLLGLGVATGCTACGIYFSRYSSFDALDSEIDQDLYLQITRLAPAEWAAVQVGATLVLLAGVLLVSTAVVTRRAGSGSR